MNRSEVFLFVFSFYRGDFSWIQFLSNDSFWMERENNLSYSSLSNILQHLSIMFQNQQNFKIIFLFIQILCLQIADRKKNKSFSMVISDDYFRQYYMFVQCMKVHNILFNYLIKESKIECDTGWNFTGHRLRPFLLSRCLSYTKQHYFT